MTDTESREAFFSAATMTSKNISTLLRRQGRKFAEHMEVYQSVLTRWSDSVVTTAAVSIDEESSDSSSKGESTQESSESGHRDFPAEGKEEASDSEHATGVVDPVDENLDHSTADDTADDEATTCTTGTVLLEFKPRKTDHKGNETGQDVEGEGHPDVEAREESEENTDVDKNDTDNELRAGVIPEQDGIEMFHNPVSNNFLF